MKFDFKKISFSEMTNNTDGKTSGSGFIGVVTALNGNLIVLISSICLLCGVPLSNIALESGTYIIGMGVSLMMGRKWVGSKIINKNKEENKEEKEI